jgi:uncharacterized membrane protein
MGELRYWIELTTKLIEALAVVLMVSFIVVGTVRWLLFSGRQIGKGYERFRAQVGKALLVGLELLVAADIIRTVVLETTLSNIVTLGILVLVRTFLGWTLAVEIDGCWPWQKRQESALDRREKTGPTLSQPANVLADTAGINTERRK